MEEKIADVLMEFCGDRYRLAREILRLRADIEAHREANRRREAAAAYQYQWKVNQP
jgi:hypothetical protein